jgi:FkbM family methyltransferase
MASPVATALGVARRARRLPGLRTLAETEQVGRLAWIASLAPLVEESTTFALREGVRAPRAAVYTTRAPRAHVVLRHGTPDVNTFQEVFYDRVYEPPPAIAERLDAVPSLRVLDLGANVGLFGAFARARFGGAEVVAYEPDGSNAAIHRRALEANGSPAAWKLVEAAAGNADGKLDFVAGEFAISRPGGGAGSTVVRCIDVLPALPCFDFLKVDIEGGEWAIIGDARFAERPPPVLVLEYHPHLCPEADPQAAARRLLDVAGYEFVSLEHWQALDQGVIWAMRA